MYGPHSRKSITKSILGVQFLLSSEANYAFSKCQLLHRTIRTLSWPFRQLAPSDDGDGGGGGGGGGGWDPDLWLLLCIFVRIPHMYMVSLFAAGPPRGWQTFHQFQFRPVCVAHSDALMCKKWLPYKAANMCFTPPKTPRKWRVGKY